MRTSRQLLLTFVALAAVGMVACKKDKDQPAPSNPVNPTDPQEVITTLQLNLHDSTANTNSAYYFEDPDGDGGLAGYYGNNGADSVINLVAGHKYGVHILLLDKTKTPVDTISNEVEEKSYEHMFFFNNGSNTILNSGNPYTVSLNGSNIIIKYLDLDTGTPQRGIGLSTEWTCPATGTGTTKHPLTVTLRHQPNVKNGTYAPGETDVEVTFKLLMP